jgi:hypothetical protein
LVVVVVVTHLLGDGMQPGELGGVELEPAVGHRLELGVPAAHRA